MIVILFTTCATVFIKVHIYFNRERVQIKQARYVPGAAKAFVINYIFLR